VGTIIGRNSIVGGKRYRQVMLYIPSEIAVDSQFFFEPGQPAEIELDVKNRTMLVMPISEKEAVEKGWKLRKRSKEEQGRPKRV
jgi:hypothetical protein